MKDTKKVLKEEFYKAKSRNRYANKTDVFNAKIREY